MKEKTVLSLSYGRIIIKPAEKLHGLVPESFETYQIVNPGDIVLRTTDLQNDHTSLRVGMVRNRGIITSAYLALRVSAGVSPDFGFQFLNVWDMSKAIYGYGSGLRQNLDFSHFKRMPVAVPPPSEQAAIVRFLDWANGRLERAIRAKRKVIALLNEQKQAIIHRAVTRGLDPSVPLKPSGIPWLGDIPQHWELRRLKWVLWLQRGFDLPADRRKIGSVPVYSSGGHIDNHDVALASPPGIVIGRYGSTDAVFFVTEPYWPHNTSLFTTTLYNNHARWCFFLLRSISKGAYAGKSAVPGVDRKDLFDIVVPRPPVGEQRAIASTIDTQLADVDRSIASITEEIKLLREYRTRLVADVVTGKLDVREAVARLPEEAAADIAEDDTDLSDETEPADEEVAV